MPRPTATLLRRPIGSLRRTMARARALLVDVDGVLVQAGAPIPGATGALAAVEDRGLPYLLATNTSLVSRATLARQAAAIGVTLDPERIVSALSVTAGLTARRFAGRPIYVLCSEDARAEFAGQWLLEDGEGGPPGEPCVAVVIGDAPEALTYANLDRAFRYVREGARLVAMHRNPWWLTPRGPTLDAGAFVVGLEFATRRRAIVAGKPSATFFAAALRRLDRPAGDVVMIGDDLRTDVAGGRKAGLLAVWVRSGRHGPDDLARQTAAGRPLPDAVAPDLAAVVAALPQR